jgi:hypothetical protein
VTLTLAPSRDALGSEKWIDLAHTEWVEQEEDRLIQIQGLIQKYSNDKHRMGTDEIILWLKRRAQEAKQRMADSNNTDSPREEL